MKKMSIVACLLSVCMILSGWMVTAFATEGEGASSTAESSSTEESSLSESSGVPSSSEPEGSSNTGSSSNTESSSNTSSDTSASPDSEDSSSGNTSSDTGSSSGTSSSPASTVKPSKPSVSVTIPMLKAVTILDATTEEDYSGKLTIDHAGKKVTGSVPFAAEKVSVAAKTTTTASVTAATPVSLQVGENKAGVLRFTYKDSAGKTVAVLYDLIITREEEVISSSEAPSFAPESMESDVIDMGENDSWMLVFGVILLLLGIAFLGYGILDCVLLIRAKKAKKSAGGKHSTPKSVRKPEILPDDEEDMSDLFAAGTLKEELSEDDFTDLSATKNDSKKK